jgi:hypothetical protein
MFGINSQSSSNTHAQLLGLTSQKKLFSQEKSTMNSDVFDRRFRVAFWFIAVVSTCCWYSLLQSALKKSTEPTVVAKNDVAHVTKFARF